MSSKSAANLHVPAHRIGHWLPQNRSLVKSWLDSKIQQLHKLRKDGQLRALDPSVQALVDLVNSNEYLKVLSQDMFTEVPIDYKDDPTGKPQVRDFYTMCELVNIIIHETPHWYFVDNPPTAMGLIGFPINAILDWPMGTNAGYQFFLNKAINERWYGILKQWSIFLTSEKSLLWLNEENGWLSPQALAQLAAKGNDETTDYTFQQLYECDQNAPYFGFTSWDNFFTRKFRPNLRPVDYPDEPIVLTNACESGPLQYSQNVQLHDQFWLKGQPYSLANMLNNNEVTDKFVGGSVYQAFLSALSYHCWHAPVSGTVVGTTIVAGTYYSENLFQGFANPNGPDPAAANNSQPYLTSVATRGIIFIDADGPIGLMAIVFVGMSEVSSCTFDEKIIPGARITKGDLIGEFHFGGSTHCMVFRPGVDLRFALPPNPDGTWNQDLPNNRVNSTLAVALPPVWSKSAAKATLNDFFKTKTK